MQAGPILTLSVVSLTSIEVLSAAAMRVWARTSSDAALAAGLSGFALLGWVFALSVRFVPHLALVNALWQSSSIFLVSLISTLAFGEHMSMVQWFGVALAGAATLCFVG